MSTKGWEAATLADVLARTVVVPAHTKYRNVPTTIDGQWFASKREAAYWQGLKARAHNGEITNLQRQVSFPIWGVRADGERQYVCEYVADFCYDEHGVRHVVDAKGYRGDKVYRLKVKFLAVQGIRVEEV